MQGITGATTTRDVVPGRSGPGPAPASRSATTDAERAVGLRRMKRVALGLLLAAAAIFVVARLAGDGDGWPGYVEATAEAAMVGALADWFAVTALFRHPLGLPIPHTAIVPRRKAALGASLGDFVTDNFLDRSIVEERVAAARPSQRVADWLAKPGATDQAAGHVVRLLATMADAVDDSVVTDLLRPTVDAAVRRSDTPEVLARALDAAVESGQHQQALDALLRGLDRLVVEDGPIFRARLGEESPWWVPEFVDDRVFAKLVTGVRNLIADVLADPRHELRLQLGARLRQLADRLRTDEALASRVTQIRDELLDRPELQGWIERFWSDARAELVRSASADDSGLRERVAEVIGRAADRLATDPVLQERVDESIVRVAGSATEAAGPEIAELISGTVERWDADDTSRRIELQIGRDLQFIRINGTLVGGLAGLTIHALADLL